jgi:AraC family transcriptional regulator, regulatory protein of adaptative response / DNA-3-methyladenine glycosylase II
MSPSALSNDHAVFERARLSRDARFDGRFFVGVRTTGIYCRPICPAVSPRSANVTFYPSAAAAAEAGYRPCLRCRPECAPGTPAWNGTSTTVRRGLRLIEGGALDAGSIEQLADRLGVTSRHLRRLFHRHVGASPLAVAHTQRLHFAKRLIDQTDLPLADVAVAAGYGSVRRFNDTFRKTYGRTPRELRRRSDDTAVAGAALTVRLPHSTPYDWSAAIGFLDGRVTAGVERVAGDTYLRTVVVDGAPGVIECRDVGGDGFTLTLHGIATSGVFGAVQRVRQMFDLDAPVADIAAVLGADKTLRPLLKRRPGIRVPGAWNGFELAVRAIIGQQVSVKAATTVAGRIAERYGEPITLPASLAGREDAAPLTRLFPVPEKLARARLIGIGLNKGRADAIRGLAAAVASGDIAFDDAMEVDDVRRKLVSLRGIGAWTAEYVALRALKDPDAFPASDLGLLKAAERTGIDGAAALARRAEAWRPWRAYAALLLWSSLAGSGG